MTTHTARTKTYTLHGARGSGLSIAAAKEDALQQIETAFADDISYYCPEMQRFPLGHVGVVFRTLRGWEYQILWPDESRSNRSITINHYATQRQAQGAMQRHVAQDYTQHEASAYGMALLDPTDVDGQREQRRYRWFQDAARAALVQGKTDREAHSIGCAAIDAA